MSTFRPAFDSKQGNIFITGSMEQPRRMEVFGINETDFNVTLLKSFKSDYLGSVCSRCCSHPYLDVFVGCNSSGRVHIAR